MATYWVRTQKAIRGPYSVAKLNELAEAGKLKEFHKVSTDQQEWVPAANVDGLVFRSFEEVESQRWKQQKDARERTTYWQNAINCGQYVGMVACFPILMLAYGATKAAQDAEFILKAWFWAVGIWCIGFCAGLPLGLLLKLVGIDVPNIDDVAPGDKDPINPAANSIAKWLSRLVVFAICLFVGAMLYGAWLFVSVIAEEWGWNIGGMLLAVLLAFFYLIFSFYRNYLSD